MCVFGARLCNCLLHFCPLTLIRLPSQIWRSLKWYLKRKYASLDTTWPDGDTFVNTESSLCPLGQAANRALARAILTLCSIPNTNAPSVRKCHYRRSASLSKNKRTNFKGCPLLGKSDNSFPNAYTQMLAHAQVNTLESWREKKKNNNTLIYEFRQ